MNLLVVDDYRINRKLLRAQLEAAGHAVMEAANGLEALEVMEREGVDAVISDILMPGMDGFRLCEEIRKNEKFTALPFIFYTSTYDSPADRQLAETIGADCYVIKPAPVPAILDALREASQKPRRKIRLDVAQHDESYVLRQYNEALVRKLEKKNIELHAALTELRVAHEKILELNSDLEIRVQDRTAALNTANKELEAFSYSVSHDLRSPLRRICGFSQLLEESLDNRLDDESRRFLRTISDQTQQMSELIDNLLMFSRMGRAEMRVTVLDLEQLVQEAIGSLEVELGGRNIEWKRSPLPKAQGDPALLRQVLVSLISNAVKYTLPREPAQIEIGYREESQDEIAVFVRDNGVGFDMQHYDRLFGVFQRLHSAEEFEGTGIGLANAQRIIARHGGRIWAEAALGQGATFFFTLPRP